MSQDVVQDWENREFIETVEVAVRKCVDFLNNFHESAKYRLSVVDARLSTLERKLDFLEASLENCDPSKRQAKQIQFKGSIFDPEIRQKLIASNEQKRQQNQRLFTKTVVAPNESMKNRPIVNTGNTQSRNNQQPRANPSTRPNPSSSSIPQSSQQQPVRTQPAPKQIAAKQSAPKQSAPKQSAPKVAAVKKQAPKQAPAAAVPPPNPVAAKKPSAASQAPPPNPMQNKKAAPVEQQQKPPPIPGGPPKPPSVPGAAGSDNKGPGAAVPPPNPIASKPPPNPKQQQPPPSPVVVKKPPSAPGAAAPAPPNPGGNKPPPAPGADGPPPAPGGGGGGPGAAWPNKTSSSIDILTLKEGTGSIPTGQSAVEIEYTGHLPSGKQFIKHREVIQLGKKQNIKGLEQAVTRIKVGSTIKLWIPARLAYGARGAGNLIPPNADLTFQLQLHRIVKQ